MQSNNTFIWIKEYAKIDDSPKYCDFQYVLFNCSLKDAPLRSINHSVKSKVTCSQMFSFTIVSQVVTNG